MPALQPRYNAPQRLTIVSLAINVDPRSALIVAQVVDSEALRRTEKETACQS